MKLPPVIPKSVQEIRLPYKPNPKQSKFHLSGAKYRLYIGAWRGGKTRAGCEEGFKQSRIYPGNCGLIGRKDFTDLRDTTMKTFFEVIPEAYIASYNKTEHHVIFKDKSEVYFRELKDGAGLGSLNLGWFYIDEAEEVEETIFERLKGRLSLKTVGRQCGFLTSNPPNEDHWLFRQFELNKDPDFATIHASTYENKEHLPSDYISSLEKLPPSWRKKYLEGQYGFTPDGQPYYAGYIEAIHKRACEWDDALPLFCGWDFGYRKPAFVVTQVDRAGRWKIFVELMGSDTTIEKFVEAQVQPLLNTKFPKANCIHYGDPACHQSNDKSEFTSFQILQSKKIQLNCRQSEYRLRKEVIEKKINTLVDGFPLLVVNPSCRIINDGFLGGYHYPAYKVDQQHTDKHDQPFHDDFYCLSGQTKIRTLNGWQEIKDLVGKEFYTYSYDHFNKRLIPTKAKRCWKSGENVELWKLTHNEGELIATPTHLIMLRDGSYRQLSDLEENDELMPFYEADRSGRGHMTITLNDGSIVDEHRYIYTWFKGNLREGYHIHHKDSNPRNNYPENLEQLTREAHMGEVYERMRRINIKRAKDTGMCQPWTQESRDKIAYWTKKRINESRVEMQCPVCHKVFMGLSWGARKQIYCSKNCLWKAQNIVKREARKRLQLVNHKVMSVGFYGFGDVFDIEVEQYHNFPANGVMVHNSHLMNALEYIAINVFSPISVQRINRQPIIRKSPDNI